MKKLTKAEQDIACTYLYLEVALDWLETELASYGDGSFKNIAENLDVVTRALHNGQLKIRESKQQLVKNDLKMVHSETTEEIIGFLLFAGKETARMAFPKAQLVYEVKRTLKELMTIEEEC